MWGCGRSKVDVASVLGLAILAVALPAMPAAAQSSQMPRLLAWEQSFRGAEEQELRWPVALASASVDELLVLDAYEARALLFRRVGGIWQTQRSVSLPSAPVAATHDGNAYVVALRGQQGVVVLEPPELTQRRKRLPRGIVPGPLAARANGTLLVYDYVGGRVVEISAGGDLVRETAVDGRVSGLAAAADGGFYASVAERANVLSFDASSALRGTWDIPGEGVVPAWPTTLAVDTAGDVAVVDRHTGRVLFYDVGGKLLGVGARRGWANGLLHFPSDIVWLGDGRLAISDRGNGRVQLFRHTGGGASR